MLSTLMMDGSGKSWAIAGARSRLEMGLRFETGRARDVVRSPRRTDAAEAKRMMER